jgi:NAD(P)-dependent dehydrogenase (short-subunit alcohol dehydrogenase family)
MRARGKNERTFMFDELQGKAVLITGSSTGIGAAVAKGFARLGATAEECVGTVLFLATDALSSYITGQVIEVNGGQLMP